MFAYIKDLPYTSGTFFLTTRSDNLKLRRRGSLKQQWLLIVTKMADIDVKFLPICGGKEVIFCG